MSLDVVKVRGVLKSRVLPVQPLHPPVDIRISITNIANVALEVPDVDRVEANLIWSTRNVNLSGNKRRFSKAKTHYRDPKPDISFSQLIADEKFLSLEYLLDFIQALEHRIHRCFIRFGGVRESRFVNSIL